MSDSKKAVQSALIIMILSLISKPLGFLREVLIASKFGSGMVTDTYFVAMTATAIINGFISSAIGTTFIPILSEIESKEGLEGKIKHTTNMINIILVFSVILIFVLFPLAPIIVKILANGFKGEQVKLTVELTRIGLPMVLFGGVLGAFTGYLQSSQKFTSIAAIGIPFNVVYIIFLVFLSNKLGIKGLMVASVLAVASQLIILIPEVRSSGYRYIFEFNLKDKYVKKVALLSFPVLIGGAVNDLNAIIDRTLASKLVEGSISALNYANRLNGLILGVFITAITTVIFPLLSKEANSDNLDGVKSTMQYGINLILLITVPATIGLITLAKPIIEIAFQRGAFDTTATLMTSQALIFYSIGLVALALRLLLNRVYYSLQDTKTPMTNGVIAVVFNIVLNLILIKPMAHAGLALATSISMIITVILMFYGLKKKIGSLGTMQYIMIFLKTGLASAVMGLVAYLTYNGIYNYLGISKLYNLISLVVAVGLAIIVYVVLCYVFKIEEVKYFVNKIKMKLAK